MTPDSFIPIPMPVPRTQEEEIIDELPAPMEREQPEGDDRVRWVGSPDTARKADDGVGDFFQNIGKADDLAQIHIDIGFLAAF